MARTGYEPIGSMGTDTPIAVLSDRPRLLFDYFQQLFAQVTNPPLDAIREELVTALGSTVGPEGNLLQPGPASCRQVVLPFPIISNDDLAKIIHINQDGDLAGFGSAVISGLYRVAGGGLALKRALDSIRTQVSQAIDEGARIIVLSDRNADEVYAPIPSLLLTSAVHHHLIREKTRTKVGLVVEAGDAREVHHMALLVGFGAGAINPYLAFESIEDMIAASGGTGVHGLGGTDPEQAVAHYIKAAGKGVLKVMSKMGVSTVASYTGAQIFEAIGLSQELVDEYFTGTVSRLGGIGLDELAAEVAARHATAHPTRPEERVHRSLELGGEYQWRREGELHLFNPETVFKLQHATRAGRYDVFKQYTRLVDDQSRRLATLRGLFELRLGDRPTGAARGGRAGQRDRPPLLDRGHVLRLDLGRGPRDPRHRHEPPRRQEQHRRGRGGRRALRAAARTATPGARPSSRWRPGRFGVTSEYLVSADDLQIKMAQGAKPGEGGQLPGHKVYPWIAKTRHSTPGVGLISPPPHHDIYSIEDLKQLIHDLKNAEPQGARPREARGRGRCRDGGRRRQQGQGRRRAHLGPRRRHGRLAPHVAEARRRALGARPGRDAADAAPQRPARPDRRADGRPAQDRP